MAQHDYVIANASGASVRADINGMALAISSNNSGSSNPSTTYAYEFWADTSANLLKIRNGANNAWITLPFSITANNTVDINGGAIDGTNIGASSAGTGAFTTLAASGALTVAGITTITTADNLDTLTLISTDTDANAGPNLNLYRNQGTDEGDNDVLGQIKFTGRNDNSQDVLFYRQDVQSSDVSDGTEDAQVRHLLIVAGSEKEFLRMNSQGFVFNESGADLDYRVESSNDINAFFIQGNTGNIAMGHAAPDTILHLKDSGDTVLTLEGGATDANCRVQFHNSSGATRGFLSYDTDDNNLQFNVNDAERMRITSGGGVAIGQTSTGNRSLSILQLASNESGLYVNNSMSTVVSGTAELLQLQFSGDADVGDGSRYVTFSRQNDYIGSITALGAEVRYNTSSDRNLKENIVDASSQLNLIKSLQVREFDWKTDSRHDVGLIAQELHEHIPNLVTQGSDEKNTFGHTMPWSVDYGKLTPYLVKAIQEQQTLIEDLKTRIETLEGE